MSAPKLSLNASAAFCWTECTAQPHYLVENAHRIPPQDSEYSVEGTVAHKVVECLFKSQKLPKDATKEMITHAQAFVDICNAKRKGVSTWWSELEVELFYMPGRRGFVDWCCVHVTSSGKVTDIFVDDFKYGKGVAVSAEENLQASIYARSLVKKLPKYCIPTKDTRVHISIYQPRVRDGETMTTWTVSYAELMQFTDDRVLGPAEDIKAKALTLTFKPGPKTCQFCPAESFCQARVDWLLDDTPLEVLKTGKAPKLPEPKGLTDEVLAKLVLMEAQIKKWLGSVSDYGQSMALAGKALPGLKLVLSKGGHRKWGDEAVAKALLLEHCKREEVVKETLISPTQAAEFEFDFPKEEWQQLQEIVVKPPGSPTLVSVDDPRPAYGAQTGLDLLEDESGEEDWC